MIVAGPALADGSPDWNPSAAAWPRRIHWTRSRTALMLRSFFRREDGATMAEYALLVAVVVLVALVGAKALGSSMATQASYLQYVWPK